MNIAEDLLGKEVIDDSGMSMGVVKDVTWDFETNHVEALIVEMGGGGFRSLFGSGDRNLVSYDNIHSIGDKILVNIKFSAPKENRTEEEDENILDRFRMGL